MESVSDATSMAINIDTLVHNEFSRSATDQLEKVIGKSPGQIKSGVDCAVTELLDGLSLMARDDAGRESIYEAARYCDDGLIDDSAIFFAGKDKETAISDSTNALSALVGTGKKESIIAAVEKASGLATQDAETITGYVAPGVLGVMKRQMLNGAVLDNPDGIGQMLLGETTTAVAGGAAAAVDHSVPKNAVRQTNTASKVTASGGASAAAAATHSDGADLSWLFRWALPFLLLGGLVLAGVQKCGVSEPVKVVDKTSEHMAQITALTAERDEALTDTETALAEVNRLKGELETASVPTPVDTSALDAANAEIVSLKEQLAVPAVVDTSALDAANAEIVSLKEQLAVPAVVDTSALDAANAEIASLKEELAKPADTTALDAANAEIASLKEELAKPADTSALDAANAEIASLKEELAKPADTSELDAANSEITRLQTELANIPEPVDNSAQILSLQKMVDDGGLKFAQLESELGTVRSKREELEATMAQLKADNDAAEAKLSEANSLTDSLKQTIADSEATIAERQAQIDALTAEIDAGKTVVTDLEGERDQLTADLKSLAGERDKLQAEVDALTSDVAKITSERDQLNESVAEVTAARDQAIADTDAESKKLGALSSKFGGLEKNLALLATARDKVTDEANGLKEEVATLEGQVQTLDGQLSAVKDALTQEQQAMAGVKDENASLTAQLAEVTEDRDSGIKTIEDLSGKLEAAESQGETLAVDKQALEESIAKTEAELQARRDLVNNVSSSLSERLSAAGLSNVAVEPINDSQAVGITMGSSDLYRVGSASLSASGSDALQTVGEIIGDYPEWKVDIEGHTDAQPIGGALREKFASNWELSVARAAAAVRYLQFKTGIPAEKMSVRGFGEYRPVDSNETREGREANRRIEVILRK